MAMRFTRKQGLALLTASLSCGVGGGAGSFALITMSKNSQGWVDVEGELANMKNRQKSKN